MSKDKTLDNRILSKITFITCLGDFLSFFAILQILSSLGSSVAVSAFSVVIKSFAIGLGGLLLPRVLAWASTRRAIVLSQVCSLVLALGLLLLFLMNRLTIPGLFGILFFQTLLKQFFEGARETHSKSLGTSTEHVSLQSQLLSGFYGAQFIGPIISFFLIRFLPIQVPLILDSCSFFVAALLSIALQNSPLKLNQVNILAPLKYLRSQSKLRDILLLRSVGFWISMGLFNYLLFSVVVDHFDLSIVNSAWVYSMLGLGAAAATNLTRNPWTGKASWIGRIPEGWLAFFGQWGFAFIIFLFAEIPSFSVALVLLVFAGVFMGINAVATQALRRSLTTQSQFSEVVGLELILGRLTDISVTSLAFFTLSQGLLTYKTWIEIAAGCWLVCGALHLRFISPTNAIIQSEKLQVTKR